MDKQPPSGRSNDTSQTLEKQISELEYAQKINYTLYDISNAVNATHNLEQLYHSIYKSLNKLLALPNFFIAIYNHKTETIHFDYFVDEHDDDSPSINNLESPNCLIGEVILTQRPLFLKENMLIDRAQKNKFSGIISKSWIGVPLIVRSQAIGAIAVQHYSNPDYFSHRHLELFISVSEQIAIAIERKQILDTLEKNKKKLYESEKNFKLIFDISPDAMIITDITTGKISNINKSFTELSGLKAKDLIGKDTTTLDIWKNQKQQSDFISTVQQNGGCKDLATTLIFKKKPIEVLVSSLALMLGNQQQIISIIKDIPDHITLEKQLTRHHRTVTAGPLASSIAHDFNVHLSDIIKHLESLATDDNTLSQKQKNDISNALISSRKATKHIRQLEDLTTSDTEKPSTIDLFKIAKNGYKTVLVIDDEDMVRDMAVKALESFGYKTFEAADGQSGVKIYKRYCQSIDAVLLDIIMPRMSGVETFKELVKINPEVKVIIVSGHITNQEQQKLFMKASAYLDKPYQIKDLKETLTNLLN